MKRNKHFLDMSMEEQAEYYKQHPKFAAEVARRMAGLDQTITSLAEPLVWMSEHVEVEGEGKGNIG